MKRREKQPQLKKTQGISNLDLRIRLMFKCVLNTYQSIYPINSELGTKVSAIL